MKAMGFLTNIFGGSNGQPETTKTPPKPLICGICQNFIEEASFYYGSGEATFHKDCAGSMDNPLVIGRSMRRDRSGGWDPDVAAQKAQREAQDQKAKDDLLFAARTRILTDAEMAEVERRGASLFIRIWDSPADERTYYQKAVYRLLMWLHGYAESIWHWAYYKSLKYQAPQPQIIGSTLLLSGTLNKDGSAIGGDDDRN